MTGARKVRVVPETPHYVRMLAAIRSRRHWTQKQLAIAIGVRENAISNWERGITEPSRTCMFIITRLLAETLAITHPESELQTPA